MMMFGLPAWMILAFSAAIFSIGFMGILIRRNILVMIMCIELMLNAVNLTFVTFSHLHQETMGQMSVFFIIVIAAVESALGLGLVIALFRTLRTVDTQKLQILRR